MTDLIERLEAFEQRCVEHEAATFRKGLGAEIYSDLISEARTALTAAQARIAELERALLFYADRDNWRRHHVAPATPCRCVWDSGSIAREALKTKGGE